MDRSKFNKWLPGLLGTLVLATAALGIYFEQYFELLLFSVWLSIEIAFWRFPEFARELPWISGRAAAPNHRKLTQSYNVGFEALAESLAGELRRDGLESRDRKWLVRLGSLNELRELAYGKTVRNRKASVREAFVYGVSLKALIASEGQVLGARVLLQDITEGASFVADLYTKLLESCSGEYRELSGIARDLYFQLFGKEFDPKEGAMLVETLVDSMQRDYGIPFLVLNLIRRGDRVWSRSIGQELLTGHETLELDEEVRSALYWMAELNWFISEKHELIAGHDAAIRYLYHLCFTDPDRVGFLEVDSRFFSHFETVSELAQEGFMFREVLVERILVLWETQSIGFNATFSKTLGIVTKHQNKIYETLNEWKALWERSQEEFGKSYLSVVEGNLCYSKGYYDEAKSYYEKALASDPSLRSAKLNLLFVFAKLGKRSEHLELATQLQQSQQYYPNVLSVIGNSFFIMNQFAEGNTAYEQLALEPGWSHRVDLYKSLFCYEHGLFEKALEFGKSAHEKNPSDTSISYHLSLCYNAVGEKDMALDAVKKMGTAPSPTWLQYYKFTLERDSGREEEASETLLDIPSEYFDDPDERTEAEEFAKRRQDLVLLQHLRKQES